MLHACMHGSVVVVRQHFTLCCCGDDAVIVVMMMLAGNTQYSFSAAETKRFGAFRGIYYALIERFGT